MKIVSPIPLTREPSVIFNGLPEMSCWQPLLGGEVSNAPPLSVKQIDLLGSKQLVEPSCICVIPEVSPPLNGLPSLIDKHCLHLSSPAIKNRNFRMEKNFVQHQPV